MSFDLMARERDFGPFGGRFVPETLMAPLIALEEAFAAAKEKGEAAFVTFVTAGYPKAEGE